MRDTTFFGLMFAAIMALIILAGIDNQKASDACTLKGGIIVETQDDYICIKNEAIIK